MVHDFQKAGNILVCGVGEENGIVSIQTESQFCISTGKGCKEIRVLCCLENTVERVDHQDEQERGQGVPLPQATEVLYNWAWGSIEEDDEANRAEIQLRHLSEKPRFCSNSSRYSHEIESKALAISSLNRSICFFFLWKLRAAFLTNR